MGEKRSKIEAAEIRGMFVASGRKEDRERVIDENLKKVFDETLDEGIPDRFKVLLNQLKQQDSEQGSDK